jgi:hypothetical protein
MQSLVTVPRVVLPSAGVPDLPLDEEGAGLPFDREADGEGEDAKSAGAPGTAHIMTSFAGFGCVLLPTRLGQSTTARLWASMRFEAARRETLCMRSV